MSGIANMKILPLIYYPTKWLVVDDDKLILDSVQEAFAEESQILTFQSPTECVEFLNKYSQPIIHNSFLKSMLNDESYITSRHASVDFDITSLLEVSFRPERFDEISVMMIDYNMPEMTGVEFVKKCSHLPIQKLLFTGEAKNEDVIEAFNINLIDRFVRKGNKNMKEHLSEYLDELSLLYFQKASLPLLQHLEANERLPQSDPVFVSFFLEYCKKNSIQEFYLIDRQGSYFCIDKNNKKSIFIVHTEKSINYWIELNKEEADSKNIDLSDIVLKNKMPFFGINREAWQIEDAGWAQHFYQPVINIVGRDHYFCAVLHDKN